MPADLSGEITSSARFSGAEVHREPADRGCARVLGESRDDALDGLGVNLGDFSRGGKFLRRAAP